jgi:hypothetical protein
VDHRAAAAGEARDRAPKVPAEGGPDEAAGRGAGAGAPGYGRLRLGGLIAYVVLSKYQDHLPLYRLEQMSAVGGDAQPPDDGRLGADRLDWLEPIYRRMLKRLLAGGYLQADETPVRFLDPDEKHGATSRAGCG